MKIVTGVKILMVSLKLCYILRNSSVKKKIYFITSRCLRVEMKWSWFVKILLKISENTPFLHQFDKWKPEEKVMASRMLSGFPLRCFQWHIT